MARERRNGRLTAQEKAVGRHYDENILEFEKERLPKHTPVEYAITCRYLERYIAADAMVAEVGRGRGPLLRIPRQARLLALP